MNTQETENINCKKGEHVPGPTGDIRSNYVCFQCGKLVNDECNHDLTYSTGMYPYAKCEKCGKIW